MKYIEKATQIISDHITPLVEADATNPDTWGEPATPQEEAQGVTQALADAGLLAPELPPVTRPKPCSPEWAAFMADWDAEPMWETPKLHGLRAGHEDGRTDIYIFRDGYTIPYFDILTPDEAAALGLALLAAAQHIKEQA